MEKSGIGKKAFLNDTRKLVLSVLLVSIAVFFVTGAFADSDPGTLEDGMPDYNIIVGVNNHDHQNLDDLFIHRCAITPPIVATCLIYAIDGNGDQILSEVEYLISREQYLQIPFRDRQNWHNHATELTPERGEPACISLPDGFECGAVVEILQTTYGKPVMLWDPSDALPSYQPYVYNVESTFALKQDLNHNLHNEWPEGDESTSSFGILNEIPGEEEEEEDPHCDVSFGDDLELDFRSTGTGDVITLGGFNDFATERVNYFIGDLEIDNADVEGDTRFSVRVKTNDGSVLTMVVTKIEAMELIEQDCEEVIWRSEGSGRLRDTRRGNTEVDFDMFIAYNLESGKINVVGTDSDNIEEVIFAFEDIVDKNF